MLSEDVLAMEELPAELQQLEWLELFPAKEDKGSIRVPAAVLEIYVEGLTNTVDGGEEKALIPVGGEWASQELSALQKAPSFESLGAWLARAFRLDPSFGPQLARAELLHYMGSQSVLVRAELEDRLMEQVDWRACRCANRLLPEEATLFTLADRSWRRLVRRQQRASGELWRPLVQRWVRTLDNLARSEPEALRRLVDVIVEVQESALEPWDVYADFSGPYFWMQHREEVLDLHLQSLPQHPVLLAYRALSSRDAYEHIALWELARAPLAGERQDALAVRWAAQHALALAAVGLMEESRAALLPLWTSAAAGEALPEGWVDALAASSGSGSSAGSGGSFSVSGLSYRLSAADLRLDVAALLVVWGQPQAADALLSSISMPAPQPLDVASYSGEERNEYLRHLLLLRGLKIAGWRTEQEAGGDALLFPLLMSWAEEIPMGRPTVLWDLVLAEVAADEGYSTYRRFFLGRATALAERWANPPEQEPQAAAQLALRTQLARRAAALFAQARNGAEARLAEARATPGTAVVLSPPALLRRSPSLAEVLPEGVRFLETIDPEDGSLADEEILPWGREAADPLEPRLPEGFKAETLELVDGDAMAVLAIGPSPQGFSGLHLLRSADGGESWPERYDLSALMSHGFVLWGAAGHQLWGDRIEVTVERNWVWQDWPLPAELLEDAGLENSGAASSRAVLKLEVDLEAVTEDRDEDGWSDLQERLLGLDPRVADSDGDGLEDLEDPFPRSVTAEFSREGEVFVAAQRETPNSPLQAYRASAADRPTRTVTSSKPRLLLHPGLRFGSGGSTQLVVDFQHPEAMIAAGLDPRIHGQVVVYLVAISHDQQQAQVLTGWSHRVIEKVRLERQPGEQWRVIDGIAGQGCVRHRLGRRAEELAREIRRGLPIGE
ncbi:MAG: hypothetical protein AAGD01_14200 [Acidobacteriota bacterium]